MNAIQQRMDQLVDQLSGEFVEDANDMLDRLDNLVVVGAEGGGAEALLEARRIVHSLKGSGATFGFRDVSLIAVRAEDFLSDLQVLTEQHRTSIQAFTDAMRRALDSDNTAPVDFKAEVRQLPTRPSFDVNDVEIREVEVLLVSSAKVLAHKVRNELSACGYRVATVTSPIMALEMAIRTQPDMIVSSTVLDGMTGVDLARALSVISTTEQIPFALLTSFERGHPELSGLPVGVGIIRVGPHFSEDVAEVLSRFEVG
ncbi:MAG: Hpt domain-containing protein [Alphaproteobacteria bacterium]